MVGRKNGWGDRNPERWLLEWMKRDLGVRVEQTALTVGAL